MKSKLQALPIFVLICVIIALSAVYFKLVILPQMQDVKVGQVWIIQSDDPFSPPPFYMRVEAISNGYVKTVCVSNGAPFESSESLHFFKECYTKAGCHTGRK